MMSPLLLAMLMAADVNGLAAARTTYSRCLGSLMRTELVARTTAEDFQAKLANSCKSEETAFRAASISVDLAAKIARPAAEQNATDEIGYIRENMIEKYKDYFDTNTLPG